MLKKLLFLSNKSNRDLKKAIFSSFIAQLSLSLPVMVLMTAFMEILKPFFGGQADWGSLWILAAGALPVVALAFAAHRYEYGKTYVTAYEAAEEKRTGLAEHLRLLPLSFFWEKRI